MTQGKKGRWEDKATISGQTQATCGKRETRADRRAVPLSWQHDSVGCWTRLHYQRARSVNEQIVGSATKYATLWILMSSQSIQRFGSEIGDQLICTCAKCSSSSNVICINSAKNSRENFSTVPYVIGLILSENEPFTNVNMSNTAAITVQILITVCSMFPTIYLIFSFKISCQRLYQKIKLTPKTFLPESILLVVTRDHLRIVFALLLLLPLVSEEKFIRNRNKSNKFIIWQLTVDVGQVGK